MNAEHNLSKAEKNVSLIDKECSTIKQLRCLFALCSQIENARELNSVNQISSSVDISSNNSNETRRETRLCTEISSQVNSSASPTSSLSTLFLSSLISPTPTSSTLHSLLPLPYLAYLEN
ncbi:unnamed protein product [Rotaria magnacalcarata]